MEIKVNNPGTFDATLDLSYIFDVKKIWTKIEKDFKNWILTSPDEAVDIIISSSYYELFLIFFDKHNLHNYINDKEFKSMQSRFKEYEKKYIELLNDMEENSDEYTEEDALPYLADSLEENIISTLFETYNESLLPLYRQVINSQSKIVTLDIYGKKTLTNYGMNLIKKCYSYFRNLIRANNNWEEKITENWLFSLPPFSGISLTDVEKSTLIFQVKEFCKREFATYINKRSLSKDMIELCQKLDEYINKNLRKLFLSLSLEKDKNDMYVQSWITSDGNLPMLAIEHRYMIEMLDKNKQSIKTYLNLNDKQYKELINLYCDRINPNLKRKIYDLLSAKNLQRKNHRAKEILQWNDDDKIGKKNALEIDFDVTNDYVRTSPIIIINDVNTNKDYVFFGPRGTSHGDYIKNKLIDDMEAKNIKPNDYKMGYGYLLGNIAFVDEQGDNFQFGYTLEDEVNILKNDPRIKKVYTTPSHPHPNPGSPAPITRFAKLIYKEE